MIRPHIATVKYHVPTFLCDYCLVLTCGGKPTIHSVRAKQAKALSMQGKIGHGSGYSNAPLERRQRYMTSYVSSEQQADANP